MASYERIDPDHAAVAEITARLVTGRIIEACMRIARRFLQAGLTLIRPPHTSATRLPKPFATVARNRTRRAR